jgi:Delta3,5-Delta2,4-dienoyl-CoA isomerase
MPASLAPPNLMLNLRSCYAGLDLTAASSGPIQAQIADPSRKADLLRKHILEGQSCISSVSTCQKPVIALMHGYAYGLAIDLSTACDIRLCAEGTRFSVKEVDIGLAPDIGTLSRLPKVMGGVTSWVKDVCLSAREFDAAEAYRVGFVSKVLPDKETLMNEGIKMASLIANKSPVAVQGTKNILDATTGRTVEDNLNYTAVWNAAMLQSSDVERAMGAGMKKRTPTFEKL